MRWSIGGGSWRLAKSLVSLLTAIDSVWPERHSADGTVGDLSHQARKSDHNPNDARVVTAADVGITSVAQGNRLVSALVASRDARIKYIIFNKRIWRSYFKPGIPAWTPAPYTGSNPHKTHVHISVSARAERYDDPTPWNINLEDDEMALTPEEEQTVKELHAALQAVGSNGGFARSAVLLIRALRVFEDKEA